ncbi:hypothetical protein GRI97_08090 [Altererythrobacter xixiisoli]|uniref:Uncharacterized protein n=1 Tax=Croceibacterium xixiisoli TaxID=1476466 RepID=A0A6I4TSM9_9SPHN|nr:hypothetical protein [Croceibacterium xixiisoli]
MEASDTLTFTPDALKGASPAPTFTLRTATTREKRMWRRLLIEEGARTHTIEAIREEMVRGLQAEWDAATCGQHIPMLREYWAAFDEHALQRKDDPDLKWECDPIIEEAVHQLEQQVQRGWRPLAKMRADNLEYGDIAAVAQIAVMIDTFSGIELEAERDGKYLTFDTAEGMREALGVLELRAGSKPGTAFQELYSECALRMFLRASTEKNSASPSPSDTPPLNSNATARGTSTASKAKSAAKTSKR